MNRNHTILLAALLASGAAGCLTSIDERTGGAVDTGWAFESFDSSHYSELPRIDAAGVPLVGTSIVERDHDVDGRYADNTYTNASPNTQLDLGIALRVRRGVVRLHKMWADDFQRMGYETCAHQIPNVIDSIDLDQAELITSGCTLQTATWHDALHQGRLGERTGSRKVVHIVFPERLLIDVNEPAGFPNGRLPWEQINDKVFALGFLALGDGVDLDSLRMNPPENDVPFLTDEEGRGIFPYLAPAHTGVAQGYGTAPQEPEPQQEW